VRLMVTDSDIESFNELLRSAEIGGNKDSVLLGIFYLENSDSDTDPSRENLRDLLKKSKSTATSNTHTYISRLKEDYITGTKESYTLTFDGEDHVESSLRILKDSIAERSGENNQKPQTLERIIEILEDETKEKYEEKFTDELDELKDVYGKNSLSTALLLRRITEKAIYYSFVEIGQVDKIRHDGDTVGLESMINTANGFEYSGGNLVLASRTAKNLLKLKELGDVAAHNFLRTVSMNEIDAEIHRLEASLEELSITQT